jgi:hypothetical protein
MALIKCGECGKDISDKSASCPNCGYGISNGRVEVAKPATESQNNGFVAEINSSYIDIPDIPVGLYMATAILGFPLGTGVAIGGYFGAKRLIGKGDYEKARKQIKSSKIACWVIVVPCAIAVVLLLAMCSSM